MRTFFQFLAPLSIALIACNAVSGASGIDLDDDDSNPWITGTGTGTNGSAGGWVGPPLAPADGVELTAVDMYQGVRRPLMESFAEATSNIPIVANRAAYVRVWYTTNAAYNQQSVIARLTFGDSAPLYVERSVGGSSTQESLDSTLNFDVPADKLPGPTSYRVELLQPEEMSTGQAQNTVFPAGEAQQPLNAQSSGYGVRVVLIPIQYNADGSGRMPDTSDAQLLRYRNLFHATYPAAHIELTVGATMPTNTTLAANGAGWDMVLNQLLTFRQTQGAAFDEYYYAVVAPATSMFTFCTSFCIAGLSSWVQQASQAELRGGMGLGFSGDASAETAIHEVGHLHGRLHAPCGTWDGLEPGYPYGDGSIGVWGYDLVKSLLISPDTSDFMSYCTPTWISDFNFNALYQRIQQVNQQTSAYIIKPDLAALYERITFGADGRGVWLAHFQMAPPPIGQPKELRLRFNQAHGRGGQSRKVTGQFFPYSRFQGGLLLFPQSATKPVAATIELFGTRRTVLRSVVTQK